MGRGYKIVNVQFLISVIPNLFRREGADLEPVEHAGRNKIGELLRHLLRRSPVDWAISFGSGNNPQGGEYSVLDTFVPRPRIVLHFLAPHLRFGKDSGIVLFLRFERDTTPSTTCP